MARCDFGRATTALMPRFPLIVALLGVGLLGGCSSVSSFRGIPVTGTGLYVSGLPPLRQNAQYTCGPACVAAVAAHWGVSLEEFRTKCPAAPQDTTGPDLRALAESLGLQAFVFQASLDDLKENLRQGRPLIVMLTQPPDPALRQWGLLGGLAVAISGRVSHPPHWVVVVGLAGDGAVIVHDPAAGLLQIEAAAFQRWWGERQNLCVLIARKE